MVLGGREGGGFALGAQVRVCVVPNGHAEAGGDRYATRDEERSKGPAISHLRSPPSSSSPRRRTGRRPPCPHCRPRGRQGLLDTAEAGVERREERGLLRDVGLRGAEGGLGALELRGVLVRPGGIVPGFCVGEAEIEPRLGQVRCDDAGSGAVDPRVAAPGRAVVGLCGVGERIAEARRHRGGPTTIATQRLPRCAEDAVARVDHGRPRPSQRRSVARSYRLRSPPGRAASPHRPPTHVVVSSAGPRPAHVKFGGLPARAGPPSRTGGVSRSRAGAGGRVGTRRPMVIQIAVQGGDGDLGAGD